VSFRKEEKLNIHRGQLIDLKNWINENSGYKLYESRIVSSTYLDNSSMQMFNDSEEGCVPRKKIRIRSYSKEEHQEGSSVLETKISSVEGRYKTQSQSFELKKILKNGFLDKDYGICWPKVRVTYNRDYYKIHQVRLTIDTQLEYTRLNSHGKGVYKSHDEDIVVEIKASDDVPIEYLFRKFHFERVRFSKYSRAINSFLGYY
jgi:SPX domain protein involved in polyphosphate accumulation